MKRNLDYTLSYRIFKNLPFINFILTMIFSFICAIIDVVNEITALGEFGFASVIIWLFIGGIVGAIVMWFTSICISPTIMITDATLSIRDSLKNGGYASEKANPVEVDELPEL